MAVGVIGLPGLRQLADDFGGGTVVLASVAAAAAVHQLMIYSVRLRSAPKTVPQETWLGK